MAGALVLLNVAKPIVFSKIIDDGLLKKNWSSVQLRCLHFLIIALVISLCSIGHGILASIVSNRFATIIKESVTDRTFKLSYDFFHRMNTGDILTRIDDDAESVRDFLMSILHSGMSSFLSFLSAVIYIGFVQWRMLIVGFLIVPFVALCMYSFRKVTYRSSLRARQARSNCNQQMVSGIGNILYLRQIGLESRTLHRMKGAFRELKAASIHQDIWMGLSGSAMTLLMAIGYVITIGYGGWLIVGGRLSIGHLFAFLTMRKRFISPLNFVGQIYRGYFTTKAAFIRLWEFYSHPVEKGIDGNLIVSDRIRFDSLHVEDIEFSYSGNGAILQESSASFVHGWNGIYGDNGAGKTTLIGLLLKILSPDRGCVLVDGVDIGTFNNQDWRRHISIVPQHTYLFDDTIRENIRLYDENVQDETILHTLQRLGMSEDIEKLANGLDTRVLDGGNILSGGQRQKIAIARAVLRDTPIYIFDEPLVHIDEKSRTAMMYYLKEALKDKIVLCVSHDDAMDDYLDCRYMISEGRLRPVV